MERCYIENAPIPQGCESILDGIHLGWERDLDVLNLSDIVGCSDVCIAHMWD